MKRRTFINKSLKAGGILTTTSLSSFNILTACEQPKEKLGVALVGLGSYSTGQLGPALKETDYCYLAGIVTGTPEKAERWSREYNIPEKNIYNYDNYDELSNNSDIDIIYVVLPNFMHAEYTIRAAKAGKHVICEKPMALNFDECQRMIRACREADRKLSIGYRLHFDPHDLESMRLGQKEVFGKVLNSSAGFGFQFRDKSKWRMKKSLSGGGPLMDVGIYAIQSTIYSTGQIPTSLIATDTTQDQSFYDDVEGSIEAELRFKSGLTSTIRTSYEEYYAYSKFTSENGWWELEPAFLYSGIRGKTSNGPMDFPQVNQQARQMDDFAQCILDDRTSIVKGEMGARDMFIIDKIYESAKTGEVVTLEGIPDYLHRI